MQCQEKERSFNEDLVGTAIWDDVQWLKALVNKVMSMAFEVYSVRDIGFLIPNVNFVSVHVTYFTENYIAWSYCAAACTHLFPPGTMRRKRCTISVLFRTMTLLLLAKKRSLCDQIDRGITNVIRLGRLCRQFCIHWLIFCKRSSGVRLIAFQKSLKNHISCFTTIASASRWTPGPREQPLCASRSAAFHRPTFPGSTTANRYDRMRAWASKATMDAASLVCTLNCCSRATFSPARWPTQPCVCKWTKTCAVTSAA